MKESKYDRATIELKAREMGVSFNIATNSTAEVWSVACVKRDSVQGKTSPKNEKFVCTFLAVFEKIKTWVIAIRV